MDKKVTKTLRCKDVTIELFHEIVTTGDITLLNQEDNAATWENLIEEYQSLVGSGSNGYLWTLKLQVERLRLKIALIDSMLKVVFFGAPSEDIKTEMIKLLSKEKIVVGELTKENYDKIVSSKVKSLEVKLNFKESELQSLTPEVKDKIEWNLIEELFTLSRILDLKYKLSAKETSVAEYAVIVKQAQKMTKNGK